MAVACFCRRASSWMFERILNTTLSNNLLQPAEGLSRSFPPLGLRKGILDSSCLLILLIITKHKNKKIKSWADLTSLFPWLTPGAKFAWLYLKYLYCLCCLQKQVCSETSNNWIVSFSTVKFPNHSFHIWGSCLIKHAYPQESTFKNFITFSKTALVKNLRLTDISPAAWKRADCLFTWFSHR